MFAVTDPKKAISALSWRKTAPALRSEKGIQDGPARCANGGTDLENCRVPRENLAWPEGEGLKQPRAPSTACTTPLPPRRWGRPGALEEAAYAQTRVQFNRPIARFQAIAFMLADMATKIEAARLLAYQAAFLESQGLPYGKASAMARLFASEAAMAVTIDAVQIFGGYGYTKDYPVERFMRDAKLTQIYEGSNEVQRLVISRYLLND